MTSPTQPLGLKDDKSIMKTKTPDTISVQWSNDFEAKVILTRKGRKPSIVEVKFK